MISQGWINLYKPKNISSFQAINKIKKKFTINKIGHAGTLDPLAEGVLPIALGKTTKLIQFITNKSKIYNFTIRWGLQTSTDDSQGKILFESDKIPSLEEINIKIKNFNGQIMQVPPKISAVKINGQRAYKLERKKIDFEIKPKNVFVKSLIVTNHKNNKTSFVIECGKGFYIRSLARDLSHQLNTFGHISSLEREKVGKFNKETSILLDDLLKMVQRQVEINCIQSSVSMLDDILAFEIVDQNNLKDLSFGRTIKINKDNLREFSESTYDKDTFFLSYKGDIVSVGKLIGNLFKPTKILI
tara:strand:- start:527 stop:1429 length:903 start_codon:yes stop_codon:yes gene_type:complete